MKRFISVLLCLLCVLLFAACGNENTSTTETYADITDAVTASTSAETEAIPDTTVTEVTTSQQETQAVTTPVVTEPADTELYHVEGVSEDDMITYFNEVCLDTEYSGGGDATLVQKWTTPISFMLHGEYTDTDYQVLTDYVNTLNSIDGFPGMYEVFDEFETNLDIYFCAGDELLERMGEATNYEMLDGAVTFWYDSANSIYEGIICYRNDIDQDTRNSVILEEIYNGLGPIQDTDIRVDSIIYSGFTTPQQTSEVDDVILKLLYHPDIACGMNASQCEEVIRYLYY